MAFCVAHTFCEKKENVDKAHKLMGIKDSEQKACWNEQFRHKLLLFSKFCVQCLCETYL